MSIWSRLWRKGGPGGAAGLSTLARRSLYVTLAFHAALLVAAGSIIIGNIFYNREYTFKAQPPPMKTYDPRQLEFKVRVSKQQRSSSRPSMAPRLVATRLDSRFALPEIKTDPKIVKTAFQPKFKAVSGVGLGAGLGTGFGLGGFGAGVSQFDFFGIQGKGEKIAILVDVSVSMVEDERGGPKGYERVRNRINQVVDALSEGSMFNLIVFADAASAWEKQLMVANGDNKTKAKLWLRPFNSPGNYGLSSGNLATSQAGLRAAGGTTRLDLALTAAFEQGADTILVISDGLPRVRKEVTADQYKAHEAQRAQWQQANAERVREWDAAQAAVQVQEERVWVPPRPARPPRASMKEGQAADPGAPAVPGHWEVRRTHTGGSPRPQPPPLPEPGWWALSDFIEHLKVLHEKLYVQKGRKLPVVHGIGYAIDKDGGDFLRGLAETYKGRYRRVARID